MNLLTAVRALGPVDLRNLSRDTMQTGMLVVPVILGLALRFGVPPLRNRLLETATFDLEPYYDLLLSCTVLLLPLLFGTVVGFLILDQRDERTLTALQVTPLSLEAYLAYRLATPLAIAIVATLLMVPAAGLLEMSSGAVLLAAIGASPLAPLMALFLAAFSRNKVQGFALQKASGVILFPPVFADFVPPEWQLAFGVFPTFWPFKLFLVLHEGQGNVWWYLLIGLAYQALLALLLMKRFRKMVVC